MHFKAIKIFLLVIVLIPKRLKCGYCLKFQKNFIEMVLLFTGIQIRVHTYYIFISIINQNICCGYTNEPSQWGGSFEHSKYV